MKKIRALFYIYRNSLTSISYYKDLKDVSLKFSFKYFFVLAFLAVTISSINTAYHQIPKIQDIAEKLLNEISELYPENLVITAKSGEWEINQPEPFVIAFPASLQKEGFDIPQNMIAFYHEGTLNDVGKLDTLILVNDVNIISRDERGKMEAYPLNNLPDGRLDRSIVDKGIENLKKFANKLPILIFALILLGAIFYYFIFRTLYISLFALVILVIGQIKRSNNNFSLYFKIALHSVTLPITMEVLFSVFNVDIGSIFGMGFFIVHLLFATIVVINLPVQEKQITQS